MPVTFNPRYSAPEDLVTGDVPLSAGLSKEQFISGADDEIDSYLGVLYATPIVIPGNAEYTYSKLVLKRISSQLASGRLLTATSSGGEDNQVHAYGKYLIEEALAALKHLATGDPVLSGAPLAQGREPGNDATLHGEIYNVDQYSQVEWFGAMTMPGGIMNVNGPRVPVMPDGV